MRSAAAASSRTRIRSRATASTCARVRVRPSMAATRAAPPTVPVSGPRAAFSHSRRVGARSSFRHPSSSSAPRPAGEPVRMVALSTETASAIHLPPRLLHGPPEAPGGFEPPNGGFADLCLTPWLRRRYEGGARQRPSPPPLRGCRAGNRTRTGGPPPWQGGALPTELFPRFAGLRTGTAPRRPDPASRNGSTTVDAGVMAVKRRALPGVARRAAPDSPRAGRRTRGHRQGRRRLHALRERAALSCSPATSPRERDATDKPDPPCIDTQRRSPSS